MAEHTIGGFFQRDHAEIDAICVELQRSLRSANAAEKRPALQALFDQFDTRLERHIRWEEEILFPAVESKESMLAAGPGRVMRLEHEEIRRCKGVARRALGTDPLTAHEVQQAAGALEQMFAILKDHNGKEEHIYYPMADEMFGPDEVEQILRRVHQT
jgi:regulator of cell morphogenesis and NO signaling